MLGVCGRMKGGGSCEMMKSWRENDVAKRKAAQRPKSVNYLGNGTHCLRQTQGGNEERRGSTYGDRVRGLGGGGGSSRTSFAEGDWECAKENKSRSTSTQTSKATGQSYFVTRKN